jgi:hypothetical protein
VTLKGPSGSENKTLKDPQGNTLQGSSVPLARQGANGDWFSYDAGDTGTSRQNPPVLYGPKINGTWPTEFKRVLPTSARYMADSRSLFSGSAIGPVQLALSSMTNNTAAPTQNPFTALDVPAGGARVPVSFKQSSGTTRTIWFGIENPASSLGRVPFAVGQTVTVNMSAPFIITSKASSGTTRTIGFSYSGVVGEFSFAVGESVTIALGTPDAAFDGTYTVTAINTTTNTFSYTGGTSQTVSTTGASGSIAAASYNGTFTITAVNTGNFTISYTAGTSLTQSKAQYGTSAGPVTVANSFQSTGSQFYNTIRTSYAAAGMSAIGTASYSMPPPLTQFGRLTINTLPSATDGTSSAVAIGSVHPAASGYGYLAWCDSSGRLCVGKYNAGLATNGATSYLSATATGVVTAGRSIAFLRIGSFFQAFVFDASNVLVSGSTLSVVIDGSDDGAFASGPGLSLWKTQDARVSNWFGLC